MGEAVKYRDLFEDDVLDKILELSNGMQNLQVEYDNLRKQIKNNAIELKIEFSKDGLSPEEFSKIATEAEKLKQAMEVLAKAQTELNKARLVVDDALSKELELETKLNDAVSAEQRASQSLLKTKQEESKVTTEYNKALESQLKVQTEANKATTEGNKALIQESKLRQQLAKEQAQQAKILKNRIKLTDDEKLRIGELEKATEQLLTDRANLMNIDREAIKYTQANQQSYYLLAESVKLTQDTLNRFSDEERKTIPVLAEMVKQTKAMKDQMNMLQKETGNYTLNVGNYQSAFDGLGWSVRNVVRELPALGINLNTFFLAISNNIPIVIDEIKRFNDEQKKVAEAGGKVESVGKKIISTVLSWQTLLVVGLTIVSKYGEQIIKWVASLFKADKQINNLIGSQEALNRMNLDIANSTKDEEVELGLIEKRLKEITQGSEEWQRAIERVNEITGQNLDATTATFDSVKDVTRAYMEQAIQLAKNKAIIDQIVENETNKLKQSQVLTGRGRTGRVIASALGEDYYDVEGDKTDVAKKIDKYISATVKLAENRKHLASTEEKGLKEGAKIYKSAIAENLKDIEEFKNYVEQKFPTRTQEAIDRLLEEYKTMPQGADKTSKQGREKTIKDYESLWKEVEQARVDAMEESYEKQVEQEKTNYKLDKARYEEQLKDKQAILEYNKNEGFITEQKYNEDIKNLNDEYNKLLEYREEEHKNKLLQLQVAYEKEVAELKKANMEQQIADLQKEYAIEENYSKRKIRNREQELVKNKAILDNIATLRREIQKLETMRGTASTTGEIEVVDEAIGKVNKKIDDLRKGLSIDKLGSRQNPLDKILIRWFELPFSKEVGESEEAYKQRIKDKFIDIYRNLGLDEETARQYAEEMNQDVLLGAMEEYLSKSKESLETYRDYMKDTLGDMIDAYMELAQAKIDAAQAGVDAAQEAYEKEKALMEAGYANNIQLAWQELEQQKAIQREAEAEQRRMQQIQESINTATQASNLITAISEILKNTALNPILSGALITTMIGSFIASRVMAHSVVASEYGDGHVELLDYGGSHASGNDMPLATDKQGRQRRVERGEAFAVFNKRAVQKHGYSKIKDIVDSINRGRYENRAMATVERDVELGMMYTDRSVNLSNIEGSLAKVVENTAKRTYIDQNGNLVETDGVNKKIILR